MLQYAEPAPKPPVPWRAQEDGRAQSLPAPRDGGGGAAAVLDDQQLDRAAAHRHGAGQGAAPELLTAEGDEKHGADIGMRAQGRQHPMGIVAGIAAGKPDQLRARLDVRVGDAAGDVVGAFHQIGESTNYALTGIPAPLIALAIPVRNSVSD